VQSNVFAKFFLQLVVDLGATQKSLG
jgi:hypothetical protein